MTDASPSPSPEASRTGETLSQGAKLLVDFGPVLVFMVAYNVANRMAKNEALFIATGAFMAATVLALGYSWLRERRIPPMILVSGVIVLVFGGLTLWLHDGVFIKLKPTIVNGLYAAVILGGLAVGVNVWKALFSAAFTLPDRIWRILAVRWALWFVFLAILNEVIWRAAPDAFWLRWTGLDQDPNGAEVFWANFKFMGVLPLTILFALANVPITAKYLGQSEDVTDPAKKG
jgi:intracellular septation protein